MLKIKQLDIAFRNKTIFKDASIEIPNSSLTAITGTSGSGKTTLLRYILGEDNNAKGILIYNNQVIEENQRNDFLFNEVSYIDQEGRFFKNMSIQDYFEFECQIHGLYFNKQEMIQCLDKVQLNDIAYQKSPCLLSTGERKRFLIAVGVMLKKNILLIDEPTASLDYRHKSILLDILHDLAEEGLTILVTTHDEEVLHASDVIYEIQDFQLVKKTNNTIVEKDIQKQLNKPHIIHYAKYKSFKLIMLFIICICLGGASIGLIAQNVSALLSISQTTQVKDVSKDTSLFLVKKTDPRIIVENSNIFDIQQQSEEIDMISKEEQDSILKLSGVKEMIPCIDIRKTDQNTPFDLYSHNQLVSSVSTLANVIQSYKRNIYITVYYPEEHIQTDSRDINGVYINDVLYDMLNSQVKSLESYKDLSVQFNALWVTGYEKTTNDEQMPQMEPQVSIKDVRVPIDVNKVLEVSDTFDTRQKSEGRIYMPFKMFQSMFGVNTYPVRQYRIICESGKEEEIKIAIENMNSLYYASNLALTNKDYINYFLEQTKTNQRVSIIISVILFLVLIMLIYAYCKNRREEISLLKREGLNNTIIKKFLSRDFIYMGLGWLLLSVLWVGIYGYLVLSMMSLTLSMTFYISCAIVTTLILITLICLLSTFMITKNIKGVS